MAEIQVSVGIENIEEFENWCQQVIEKAKELNTLMGSSPVLKINAATTKKAT